MSEVIIDKEKLSYGLKNGIGQTDTIFADGPYEYRLRYSPCGLVSSAIHEFCQNQGIPSGLVISSPRLSFDPNMQHVVPIVGESALDGLVVDAAYSQFLGFVGLSWGFEKRTKEKYLPDEEIISFKFSERDVVINWLTDVAGSFKPKKAIAPACYEDHEMDWLGKSPLSGADPWAINKAYSAIWDPANIRSWEPPERVINHGKQAARFIPDSAISID